MIENGQNGLVYKNGDLNSLYKKVTQLLEFAQRNYAQVWARMLISQYVDLWNPDIPAKRFYLSWQEKYMLRDIVICLNPVLAAAPKLYKMIGLMKMLKIKKFHINGTYKKISIKSFFKNRVTRNPCWLIGGNIVYKLIAFIVGIWTARFLGPSNYGLINYALAYTTFFFSLSSLGINSVIVKEFVDHPNEEGETMGTTLVLTGDCKPFISSCYLPDSFYCGLWGNNNFNCHFIV